MECTVLFRGHIIADHRGSHDGHDVASPVLFNVATIREPYEEVIAGRRRYGDAPVRQPFGSAGEAQ